METNNKTHALVGKVDLLYGKIKNFTGYTLALTILAIGFSFASGYIWLQIVSLGLVYILGLGSASVLWIKGAMVGYRKTIEVKGPE